MIKLVEAESPDEFKIAIYLFKEYAAQIGVDLEFQNFSGEIENIESQYSKPKGVLFLANQDGNFPIGCFAIRELDDTICELKRMYLKKEGRGLGVGKQMLRKAIEIARQMGYSKMRLDTLPTMTAAINLYQHTGFYEIDPYRFNPIAGTKYFEINLNQTGTV